MINDNVYDRQTTLNKYQVKSNKGLEKQDWLTSEECIDIVSAVDSKIKEMTGSNYPPYQENIKFFETLKTRME